MQDDNDDFSLFTQQMKGVRRIQVDQADIGKSPADKQRLKQARNNALLNNTTERIVDGMSDQFVLDVSSEEELYWARDGVQESQMRKLKAGQIAFEGSIDLHGMKVDQARSLMWDFLAEASKFEVRCVRITHGKAARKDGRVPLLKSHVNTWLRQHEQVLGFTSCQARHGGAGAVYVLLKRNMLEGRDESFI